MNHLNRDQAPFNAATWAAIDQAAVEAARQTLTGRRFLNLEGPYGLGLTTLERGNDGFCQLTAEDEAGAVVSHAISVPMLRKACRLSSRRLAACEETGMPMSLKEIEDAAESVARREEAFIYYGMPDFGLEGLLTADGRHEIQRGDWTALDAVLNDVILAITRLDDAGFHGPYSLALPAAHYNNLFRRYENTDLFQIQHLKSLCTNGVHKAAIDQPVLVDDHVGALVLGQDLRVGYSGTDGIHYQLFVCESLVLRVDEVEAVCVLKGKG